MLGEQYAVVDVHDLLHALHLQHQKSGERNEVEHQFGGDWLICVGISDNVEVFLKSWSIDMLAIEAGSRSLRLRHRFALSHRK